MGEVYRAHDTCLDRCVAVKILPSHPSSSPELKSRFEREAKTLSSVPHPHICHLYDVGSQDGVDFLVMELLEGETLATRLRRGPLSLQDLLKIGMEIADALARAHRLGITHRDLKPSNIMLTKTGAKLMDFGLAKPSTLGAVITPSSSAAATATLQSPATPISTVGMVVGTIHYMSPEQIEGKEADARSDVFALGAVLYEMATGRRAFDGKSHLSVASAILQKDPLPITTVQPASPSALDFVIRTSLAKDPDDRFQTAHDVKLQLIWLLQSGSAASQPAPTELLPRRSIAVIIGLAAAFVIAMRASVVPGTSNRPRGQHARNHAVQHRPAATAGTCRGRYAGSNALARWQALGLCGGGRAVCHTSTSAASTDLIPLRYRILKGATFPFFSPNGDWVAFFSQGKLEEGSNRRWQSNAHLRGAYILRGYLDTTGHHRGCGSQLRSGKGAGHRWSAAESDHGLQGTPLPRRSGMARWRRMD